PCRPRRSRFQLDRYSLLAYLPAAWLGLLIMAACYNRRACDLLGLDPLLPFGADQTHARDPLHGGHHIDGAAYRPPTVARFFHECPAIQPYLLAAWRGIATEAAPVEVEG